MRDAWLNRTRQWLAAAEKLSPLPEQEFALWALARAVKPVGATLPVVCVWGEPGSGRTALVRHVLRQLPNLRRRKILVADAGEWAASLAEREVLGQPAISANEAELVVCEDLQRLDSLPEDSERLAGLIDLARSEGISVILTADRLPSQIADVSPRLLNRLQGGVLAGIRPLGEASLRQLQELWTTSAEFPAMILKAIPAAVTTAGQWKQYLALKQHPTGSADVKPTMEVISLELIAETVAREFHVSLDDLCSGTRTQPLKIPRGVAMTLARELTPNSLALIGRHFGCRSHTSVVRSCARLQDLLPNAPSLREQVQLLRAKLRQELSADCG